MFCSGMLTGYNLTLEVPCSSLTVAELRAGIALMSAGKRRMVLGECIDEAGMSGGR